MASPIPAAAIAAIERAKGVNASVLQFVKDSAARQQAAIDAAIANGATEAELKPVQDELDSLNLSVDDVAAAIATNP